MNSKYKQLSAGFTIVELLIVIVIIAILAAITVVAFNGIQTRAENNKTMSGIATYMRAIQAYKADKGVYPTTDSYNCITNNDSATCGVVSGSTCFGAGIGPANANAPLNNSIRTTVSKIPEVSSQQITCNSSGSKVTGAFVLSLNNNATMYLYYFLRGNVDCGSPAGAAASKQEYTADTSFCTAIFN